jgi:DNA-binding MarR family transcriptional regulator
LSRLGQRRFNQQKHRSYSLTEQGQESVASLAAARREGVAAYVSDLGPEDRRRLEAALDLRG